MKFDNQMKITFLQSRQNFGMTDAKFLHNRYSSTIELLINFVGINPENIYPYPIGKKMASKVGSQTGSIFNL